MSNTTLARNEPSRPAICTAPPDCRADDRAEVGPGLAHALALMTIGAGAASLWWGAVVLYLLMPRLLRVVEISQAWAMVAGKLPLLRGRNRA